MGGWFRKRLLASALLIATTCTVAAEDFLYIFTTSHNVSSGRRHDVLWLPASSPHLVRPIYEGSGWITSLASFRHQDELWWIAQDPETNIFTPKASNLVGQGIRSWPEIEAFRLARQDEWLYVSGYGKIQRVHLKSGESQSLLDTNARHLGVYEDRVYFAAGLNDSPLQSMRINGTGKRVEADGRECSKFVIRDDYLYCQSGWKMDLKSGEVTESVHMLEGVVTDEASYWIENRAVWRSPHDSNEVTLLYQNLDVGLYGIAAISASPHPINVDLLGHPIVEPTAGNTYQILYSNDLQTWSPDYIDRSNEVPSGWLNPMRSINNEMLAWQPNPSGQQAFYQAWQYHLGPPFDADADGLPDYWERRHFGDLTPTADGDANGDGIKHLEEAELLIGPGIEDADGDGLTDIEELQYVPRLNPLVKDTDGDGIDDWDEVHIHLTNPHLPDGDGDGFNDIFELEFDSDPNSPASTPSRSRVLAVHESDLTLHMSFDKIEEDSTVLNVGTGEGAAKIHGSNASILPPSESPTGTPVLELLNPFPTEDPPSYLRGPLTLRQAGIFSQSPFTISLWVKTYDLRNANIVSFDYSIKAPSLSLILGPNQGKIRMFRFIDFGGVTFTTEPALKSGVWTHVAWIRDSPIWKLYIDGRLHSETEIGSFQIWDGGPFLTIGAPGFSSGPFHGAIDDLQIYTSVLPDPALRVLAQRQNDAP